jgi:hypothetical protein
MVDKPVLRQSAANAVAKGQARTCKATFSDPTADRGLVVVNATLGGGSAAEVVGPVGFTQIRNVSVGNLQSVTWYYEGAAPMDSVTVSVTNTDRSIQVRAKEYKGAAQSGALDKVTVLTSVSGAANTGSSGTTAQADEIVVAFVSNRYATTTQSGFGGGLTKLFESLSPASYGFFGSNADADRTRLTVHELITSAVSSFALSALLSSARDWIAILVTFRGGSSGPKRITFDDEALSFDGTATLSAFGPLRYDGSALEFSGTVRMLPFAYQFQFGGLLLGKGTRYEMVSHDGLYGHQVRSSDDDQPRGDGALRGVDLQSARQVLCKVRVDALGGDIGQDLAVLYRALVPRRYDDVELVWRHPGQSARMLRCRPIDLPREVDQRSLFLEEQSFVLRAADPRHYSAVVKSVTVPVTPAGAVAPVTVNVFNAGDVPAYPVITIVGPTSGPPVNRIELVNETAPCTYDVQLTLPGRATLIGDMEARITGAPRSTVTLDGVSKYGSWQLPRSPFRLDPDPTGQGGYNVLRLRTEPAGAPVVCTIDYRDTSAG